MFSELVDRLVREIGRPDAREDLAYWANVTMRDISRREDWPDDSVEESFTPIDPSGPAVFSPAVGRQRFRREDILLDACGCEAIATKPNARLRAGHTGFSYYHSGGSLVITGACWPVALYYYAYQPWLQYYAAGSRPAEFDVATNDWNGASEAAIALVSNWMLERHSDVVMNGTMSNFFASKQDPRQQVKYAAYEQGINHIIRGESPLEILARR